MYIAGVRHLRKKVWGFRINKIVNKLTFNLRETKQARTDRKDEYPEIGEQLDMLYHAIDADSDLKTKFSSFYNTIKSVKEKYPKPS